MPIREDYPNPTEEEMSGKPMPPKGAPAPGGAPAEGEMGNPVVSALQTIKAFISAQKEKNNPATQQAIEAFTGLIQAFQAMGGKGGEQPPEAESPEMMDKEKMMGNENKQNAPMPEMARRGAKPVI